MFDSFSAIPKDIFRFLRGRNRFLGKMFTRTRPVLPQKAEIADTFIGVVAGDEDSSVSIGVLDCSSQTTSAKSFQIETVSFEHYHSQTKDHSSIDEDAPDLLNITNFLDL